MDHYKSYKKIGSHSNYYGFENDIDWSKFEPKHVYEHARSLAASNNSKTSDSFQFHEVTSKAFFDQVSAHFAEQYKEYYKHKDTTSKFKPPDYFFQAFTIE